MGVFSAPDRPSPRKVSVSFTAVSEQRYAVLPGVLQTRNVQVGRDVPISPRAIPRFLARLMSHAHLLDHLDTGAVWSVAREEALGAQISSNAVGPTLDCSAGPTR